MPESWSELPLISRHRIHGPKGTEPPHLPPDAPGTQTVPQAACRGFPSLYH